MEVVRARMEEEEGVVRKAVGLVLMVPRRGFRTRVRRMSEARGMLVEHRVEKLLKQDWSV